MIISSTNSFFSLIRISLSVALIFILSGCMEDKNYFSHTTAAAFGAVAGVAGACMVAGKKPKRTTKITTTSRKIIPQRIVEVKEEEEFSQ